MKENSKVEINNQMYEICAVSVKGEGKLENQDSYSIKYNDNTLVLVIADGLGSAPFSKEGSSKIVDICSNYLLRNNIDDNFFDNIISIWKKSVKSNFNLYDTTIRFIHINNESLTYGSIGDGWTLIDRDEVISVEANNVFSNQTDTIMSFNAKEKLLINKIDVNRFNTLLLSTDGFSEDIEKSSSKQFINKIVEDMNFDLNLFTNNLEDNILNWPVKSNKDDKTVIILKKG